MFFLCSDGLDTSSSGSMFSGGSGSPTLLKKRNSGMTVDNIHHDATEQLDQIIKVFIIVD